MPVPALTLREREVADAVARGLTSKQIARAFGVSPRTVEKHRENAMRKLGAISLSQLIQAVWEMG
ncbi:LuxR C-terminal-related transcriptional regulator [Lysobacter sp. MMG2]|uniref:LuxR C-terminal-related transcriptional regulator n=1 Tax=Lysobacter sp. MMG2 TaxID=2801338 RepID=UPI001C23CDC0|nr:LuxR C-terminal-related transcriptional regulator [Lysobacter sp. MMG2]